LNGSWVGGWVGCSTYAQQQVRVGGIGVCEGGVGQASRGRPSSTTSFLPFFFCLNTKPLHTFTFSSRSLLGSWKLASFSRSSVHLGSATLFGGFGSLTRLRRTRAVHNVIQQRSTHSNLFSCCEKRAALRTAAPGVPLSGGPGHPAFADVALCRGWTTRTSTRTAMQDASG